jgi:hypothetical protein
LKGCYQLLDWSVVTSLFARHRSVAQEFALAASLLLDERCRVLDHDLVDSAFLLRWNEMTADGNGPEELPPLTPRAAADRLSAIADDLPQARVV